MRKVPQKRPVISEKKEHVSETVYQAVKNMVFLNRFKPGRRLNVERLARELGVSRTPTWEAIRRLEQDGIVRKVPNRGVYMQENSLERVLEQIEVLDALDKLAAGLACTRMSASMVDKLSQCLPGQLRGIEAGDLVLYGQEEMRFHRLIYEASGNAYLVDVFDSITLQMLPSRLNHLPALPSIYLVHVEIVEAFTGRDAARVQAALTHHAEIMSGLIRDQIRAETERKEMVRRIKEGPSPSAKPGRMLKKRV